MMTHKKGCLAYYVEESLRVPERNQQFNLLRNYRKGVLFALKLKKKGFDPKEIMELGPGSGYFVLGIKLIFPQANITVVDIVDDVLENNKNLHGYQIIKGTPEHYELDNNKKFDLILARDILEHVTDIGLTVRNVSERLTPNGLFHFITPNGHGDIWKHHQRWKQTGESSELLINHVNYFMGEGLEKFLHKNGLTTVEYYTYQTKAIRKGRSWNTKPEKMAPVSQKRSAASLIEKQNQIKNLKLDKEAVINKWYLSGKNLLLTKLICLYYHYWIFKISPKINLGLEIHGVFQKKS